jgi:tRNA uridine 5-carboxymethylaminomethyl modification enzyme
VTEQAYQVVVVGGGHAGVEAAWAAASVLSARLGPQAEGSVALVTMDPSKIGVMSCNPAIGGLAKGQLVREVDALGGVMGLAADATGIQFRMLNTSKGPAVHGPRAQCDKHAYARAVQRLIASRTQIRVIAGSVERLVVQGGRLVGVVVTPAGRGQVTLRTGACVLTTGTFMRGLMHTGERRSPGGRFGEAPATGISGALAELGFELGRLKTGTPPRLQRGSIDWESLEEQRGDDVPTPFSELSGLGVPAEGCEVAPSVAAFPCLPQVSCRQTSTTAEAHDLIRANLHRAPMYTGQIESVGPRYCPSIEDKVVRFAQRDTHGVFLEPESLEDDWIYCNGISTSLPEDVQDALIRSMPGCGRARVLRYGYAVEYDMVRPHQIDATGMTKRVAGLFLAGQINGTSGYEEAAAQGLVAGLNAARLAGGEAPVTLGRDQAYIGVLMDDLVTKTPVEPYRMFTSRAEHRLVLRADNAPDRLTPLAERWGLLAGSPLGDLRRRAFGDRRERMRALGGAIDRSGAGPGALSRRIRAQDFGLDDLRRALPDEPFHAGVWSTVLADRRYEAYAVRVHAEIKRQAAMEHRRIPELVPYESFVHLRTEARQALERFRPRTFGQASRLEGITPADVTLLAVLVERWSRAQTGGG